jgi:N-acetylglutamate synthase-like GNAT family acetyltransferase
VPDRRGELAAALNRALVWRACRGSRATIAGERTGGWVTRFPAAALVHHLNTVRLRERPLDSELEAIAERYQSGLGFRRVAVEDDAGDPPAGWTRERVVVMVRDGARAAAHDAGADAWEVDEPALTALERRIYSDQDAGPELVRQLSVAQAAMRAATECRRFAAGDRAEPAAMATLFLDRRLGVGLVESVGTLRMWREQRLGTAAMNAALTAAREAGVATVGVVTDAEDWPQIWYANLGFEPVRRHVAYVRVSGGTPV